MQEKKQCLYEYLRSLGRVAVAFSGGVDSTLLAYAAQDALGENAIAVTAVSPTLTAEEREDAARLARQIGIRHRFAESGEMADCDFVRNDKDRCYYCKRVRMGEITAWARQNGYDYVAEGSNVDDAKDYRPGARALAELEGIVSPLKEAGMTKADIRALSKELGLATWNKQSAACLASRLAYGLPITAERLGAVEEAERIVREYADGQVRVRHHGEVARIEVEEDAIAELMKPSVREAVSSRLRAIGFRYVTLDLTGYRMGSLNESLAEK